VITKSVPAKARSRTFAIGIEYISEHAHRRALAAAGSGFEDGVTYATSPDKAAWIHLRGVTSLETAALEMEAVAALSKRCPDPVYHLIIAYAKHERPTREQVVSDADRVLDALGMKDRQYVLAAHQDTDDFHAHVIANRVGRDGRANDLWHERIVRERVCAEIAAERGWDIVIGHHNRDIVQRVEHLHELPQQPEHRLSDAAYRRLREHGEVPWQDAARPHVLDAVDRAGDWADLHRRLAAHGVVVKLVRRGERVQGLAFAEGFDRAAPGCGASRIDARCALSALERRFGPFVPLHEPSRELLQSVAPPCGAGVADKTTSQQWREQVRPLVLEVVDSARSWDELRERLGRHGVVVKLVKRGDRVQGLAFAQSDKPDAPGCGASRIDPRCKKAALEERFGPFPSELTMSAQREHSATMVDQQSDRRGPERGARSDEREARRLGGAREWQRSEERENSKERSRGKVRQRVDQDLRTDPDWALREAGRIADHARLRSDYDKYHDRFFEDTYRAVDTRHEAAWERERALRRLQACRRHEARLLLRAVARIGTRGLTRQVTYWTIDALMAQRRLREYRGARARWEATKIVLAAERGRARGERPMDYRSFVAEQSRAGDAGAQRVLADLAAGRIRRSPQDRLVDSPLPDRPSAAHQGGPSSMTTQQVKARLAVIRAAEVARSERARRDREGLEHAEAPPKLDHVLDAQRRAIQGKVAQATAPTEEERLRIKQLAGEKRSWNPLKRMAATRAEDQLRAGLQSRYSTTLQCALKDFEQHEIPRQTKRNAAIERRHRQYLMGSLGLEREMNEARHVVRHLLPSTERALDLLERAGVQSVDGLGSSAGAREIAAAVDRTYRSIPQAARREAERQQPQQHARGRVRESPSIGGR
jgi:hypothetical protein